MKKSWHFILLFFALLPTANLVAQERYAVKPGDPNGISKWYMGRQIAHVMSHYGIEWLERKEREMEENTTQLLKNLAVHPGTAIADIGAGSGYHSTLGTGPSQGRDALMKTRARRARRLHQGGHDRPAGL